MELIPQHLDAPHYPRRRQQLVATAFLGAAGAMMVVVFLGHYLTERAALIAQNTWELPVPLTQPNVMMGTLVLAVIAAQWGSYAIARDYRYHAYWALGITVLLGLAFLNQAWFLMADFGPVRGEDSIAGAYYSTLGMSVALVAIALVYSIAMGLRTLAGSYNSRYPEGVASAALFWYIATGAFGIVWYGILITK